MKYALIVNNEVRELFNQRPVFHPSLEIDEVDDSVEVYFVRQDGEYAPPAVQFAEVPPVDPEMQALLDRIAALEAKLGDA